MAELYDLVQSAAVVGEGEREDTRPIGPGQHIYVGEEEEEEVGEIEPIPFQEQPHQKSGKGEEEEEEEEQEAEEEDEQFVDDEKTEEVDDSYIKTLKSQAEYFRLTVDRLATREQNYLRFAQQQSLAQAACLEGPVSRSNDPVSAKIGRKNKTAAMAYDSALLEAVRIRNSRIQAAAAAAGPLSPYSYTFRSTHSTATQTDGDCSHCGSAAAGLPTPSLLSPSRSQPPQPFFPSSPTSVPLSVYSFSPAERVSEGDLLRRLTQLCAAYRHPSPHFPPSLSPSPHTTTPLPLSNEEMGVFVQETIALAAAALDRAQDQALADLSLTLSPFMAECTLHRQCSRTSPQPASAATEEHTPPTVTATATTPASLCLPTGEKEYTGEEAQQCVDFLTLVLKRLHAWSGGEGVGSEKVEVAKNTESALAARTDRVGDSSIVPQPSALHTPCPPFVTLFLDLLSHEPHPQPHPSTHRSSPPTNLMLILTLRLRKLLLPLASAETPVASVVTANDVVITLGPALEVLRCIVPNISPSSFQNLASTLVLSATPVGPALTHTLPLSHFLVIVLPHVLAHAPSLKKRAIAQFHAHFDDLTLTSELMFPVTDLPAAVLSLLTDCSLAIDSDSKDFLCKVKDIGQLRQWAETTAFSYSWTIVPDATTLRALRLELEKEWNRTGLLLIKTVSVDLRYRALFNSLLAKIQHSLGPTHQHSLSSGPGEGWVALLRLHQVMSSLTLPN
eukprot:GCRY01004114.1.p1 GENE.GCRY01004114.1~~GCRY01004114.1.p1  ORF type:complete len:730 (-),score=249.71 GCRY01004114.1:1827-4016(-)